MFLGKQAGAPASADGTGRAPRFTLIAGAFVLQRLVYFIIAQRENRDHFVADPVGGVGGGHAPVCGAAGKQFDDAEAQPLYLGFESRFDGLFGLDDVAGVVEAAADALDNAGQGGHHFSDAHGLAGGALITAVWR